MWRRLTASNVTVVESRVDFAGKGWAVELLRVKA